MEAEVAEAISKLSDRISYQEHLHREINPKTNSFVHWDNTDIQVLIVSVLLSTAATCAIVYAFQK